ncbi:putative vesicle-associated membrane-protein-associated protein [Helianthus anomalus]
MSISFYKKIVLYLLWRSSLLNSLSIGYRKLLVLTYVVCCVALISNNCMRPPGAILTPGESIVATVFKFVEPSENNEIPIDRKRKVKFKIMSLKGKGMTDYVPELFYEQKDLVTVEQILQVVFLDVARPSPVSFLICICDTTFKPYLGYPLA